jgi:hypothetical protein
VIFPSAGAPALAGVFAVACDLVVEDVLLLLWAPLMSFLSYNPEPSGDASVPCVAAVAGVPDVAYVSAVAGIPSVAGVLTITDVPAVDGAPCFSDVPAVPGVSCFADVSAVPCYFAVEGASMLLSNRCQCSRCH